MATFKIVLYEHKTLQDGAHPLMFRFLMRNQRRLISSGHSFTKEEWDLENRQPKNMTRRMKLWWRQKQLDAETALFEAESRIGPHFTIDDWVYAFKGELGQQVTVQEMFQRIIDQLEKTGRIGNANAYKNALRILEKDRNFPTLTFKQLDVNWLDKFESRMISERGVSVNGVAYYLRTIRSVWNKAIRADVAELNDYPFRKFRIRTQETLDRNITAKEMAEFFQYKPRNFHEQLSIDLFKFSFLTIGMNLMDICLLTKDNILRGRLEYRRSKTGRMFSVKLTEESQVIIDKYKGKSHLFPILENTKDPHAAVQLMTKTANKYVQRLAKEIGCNGKVTFMSARYTWANIAAELKIEPRIIAACLGHGERRSSVTEVYLNRVSNEEKDEANSKVIQLVLEEVLANKK